MLRDGDGLTMAGRGLVARNNVIYNATADGVDCRGCADTVIESNTVQRADGTGIWIAGYRITVHNNTVSDSVLRTQGDADGIRFFGNGHRLTGNTIKDIKASGYPRGGPHTDCFQTYDTRDAPPTYDVIIANNVCTNVDVQALIATTTSAVAEAHRRDRSRSSSSTTPSRSTVPKLSCYGTTPGSSCGTTASPGPETAR